MPTSKEDYWNTGLWLSLVGHVIVLVIVIVRVFPNFGKVPPPVVYSISLESGKVLGGKGQVPKESKKSKLAPIKKASAEKPPEKNKKKASTSKNTSTTKTVSLAKKSTKNTKTAKVKKKSSTPKSTKKKVVSKKKTSKAVEEDVDKRLQAALQRYLGESSQGGGKGFGAAKVGGKGMGGGVVRPPEFFAYEKIVRTRIKDAWRWYKGNSTLITVIAFRIEPDGTIKNVRLVKSSGDENFDESVTRAAMKASPLPAPPVSVYERYFREVRITFDPRD